MSIKKRILLFSSIGVALFLYQLLNDSDAQEAANLTAWPIPKHLSCGPAALIKVSQAHSEKITDRLYTLLRSDSGSKAAGMKPVALKIEAADLTTIPLPAVVHLNQNHFLALTAIDDKKVVLVDQGNLTNQIT